MHCRVKLISLATLNAVLAFTVIDGLAQDAPPPLAPLPELPVEDAPTPALGDSPKNLTAPPEVVNSAVAAVSNLGDEVVLGRYAVAIERMNPTWKERTAKRVGGMAELEKQLSGISKQMVQQGISMISFKPQGQTTSHQVGPGKKSEVVNGETVETLIFNKWLVIIPTVTKFRIIRQGETKPIVIESVGFQVAISDKEKLDWTFIDGSGLTVNDLRTLFVTLPQDLQFPALEKRESR